MRDRIAVVFMINLLENTSIFKNLHIFIHLCKIQGLIIKTQLGNMFNHN